MNNFHLAHKDAVAGLLLEAFSAFRAWSQALCDRAYWNAALNSSTKTSSAFRSELGTDTRKILPVCGGPSLPDASRPLTRVACWMKSALSFRHCSHNRKRWGISSTLVPAGRTTPKATPSSTACAAPCPISARVVNTNEPGEWFHAMTYTEETGVQHPQSAQSGP